MGLGNLRLKVCQHVLDVLCRRRALLASSSFSPTLSSSSSAATTATASTTDAASAVTAAAAAAVGAGVAMDAVDLGLHAQPYRGRCAGALHNRERKYTVGTPNSVWSAGSFETCSAVERKRCKLYMPIDTSSACMVRKRPFRLRTRCCRWGHHEPGSFRDGVYQASVGFVAKSSQAVAEVFVRPFSEAYKGASSSSSSSSSATAAPPTAQTAAPETVDAAPAGVDGRARASLTSLTALRERVSGGLNGFVRGASEGGAASAHKLGGAFSELASKVYLYYGGDLLYYCHNKYFVQCCSSASSPASL